MREWWFSGSTNMLLGIEGDEDNPARLPDMDIASFFNMIPEARDSYLRVRPVLTAEEQARCDLLLAQAQSNVQDPTIKADAFQAVWNRQGVRTAGRYGGTRRGGNC